MIKPPPEASPEEYHCQWYQITDKISYLPAGMVTGKVQFKACFHDLVTGVQTHCYAPMGLDIKEKWTLGGNLPHEPVQPAEIGIGAPISGLYLREDVEIKCNFMMTRFVKKTLKDALAALVARLLVKSQLQEAVAANHRLTYNSQQMGHYSPPQSPLHSPPLSLMSQAVRSSPPNSAPLGTPYRPEWAQNIGLGIKEQHRSSLPPIPSYNPQDYQPVSEMDTTQNPNQMRWAGAVHHPSHLHAELPGN